MFVESLIAGTRVEVSVCVAGGGGWCREHGDGGDGEDGAEGMGYRQSRGMNRTQ